MLDVNCCIRPEISWHKNVVGVSVGLYESREAKNDFKGLKDNAKRTAYKMIEQRCAHTSL